VDGKVRILGGKEGGTREGLKKMGEGGNQTPWDVRGPVATGLTIITGEGDHNPGYRGDSNSFPEKTVVSYSLRENRKLSREVLKTKNAVTALQSRGDRGHRLGDTNAGSSGAGVVLRRGSA